MKKRDVLWNAHWSWNTALHVCVCQGVTNIRIFKYSFESYSCYFVYTNIFVYSFVLFFSYKYIQIYVYIQILYSSHPGVVWGEGAQMDWVLLNENSHGPSLSDHRGSLTPSHLDVIGQGPLHMVQYVSFYISMVVFECD